MNTIKQKLLNFILSLLALLLLSACQNSKHSDKHTETVNQGTVNVAILMPIYGKDEILGFQYSEMIKMGLQDGAKAKIKATIYDTSDEQELSNTMARIVESDTKVIIGPLYSSTTKKIAEMAERHKIAIITLSNDPTIASQNIFVFGHAPMRQLDLITNHLLESGYKNFIALMPAGNYSKGLIDILGKTIKAQNASLVATELYQNNAESISKAVSAVASKVDELNENADNLKLPVILVADDQMSIKVVISQMSKYNLDKKAVLAGDNRLDSESAKALDIIYTGSLNVTNTDVEERSKQIGASFLSFMHLLAYDAGKITATSIGKSFNRKEFFERLSAPELFIGLSGNIYFTDSIAQRQYDIIKKENNSYRAISVAE